jgi:hypothetical protein
MLSASDVSDDLELRNIVESTAAIIFLGTPHRGSLDMARLGETARKIASAVRMDTSSTTLDALGLKTSDLERCQESFSRLWAKYDFRVKTFQEGLGLRSANIGALNDKVRMNLPLGHKRSFSPYRSFPAFLHCLATLVNKPRLSKPITWICAVSRGPMIQTSERSGERSSRSILRLRT